MNSHADYVTDWFMPNDDLRSDAIVAVAHKSKKIGLYKVKGVGNGTMTLSHGGISFPVGTQLVVDDFLKLVPSAAKPLCVKVVKNNAQGIQIVW
ncbi:MAG: hypothetical protein WBX11_15085 [Thiobacillaceae bacterium]|jgi:hypothetical protein